MKILPFESKLPAANAYSQILVPHRPKFDVRAIGVVLECRLGRLLEVVHHLAQVFVVAVRRIGEFSCAKVGLAVD